MAIPPRRSAEVRESLLPLLLIPLLVLPVVAQDDEGPVPAGAVIFPSGDRAFRQSLTRSQQAIAEERYDDALQSLGAILTPDPSKASDEEKVLAEDYFFPNKERETLSSLKSEAMRLLDTIPTKAMKQYELQHGADARRLLTEAMKQGDAGKLAEVMRRYYHTEAGYQATLVLGRLNLENGRPLSAVSLLQRLVETPAARQIVEPEASVLLAAAWHHSGRADQAQKTLVVLKQQRPNFVIRGGASPAFSSDAEALPWLEKLFGRPHAADPRAALQWTMFRGGMDRNAATNFAEPVSLPRWRIPIVNDPVDEQLVADAARSFEHQGIPSLPSIHPLAVQNVVLMRGPDRLVAVDMASGKRIWEHPWSESSTEKAIRSGTMAANANNRPGQLKQRVWDDAPQGQLSSDGEVVYVVGALGDSLPYSTSPPVVFDPFNRTRVNPFAPRTNNRLHALSLSKQGKLLWELPAGGDQDPLREAFFLGPPLPVNGQLFVIAEIKGEIALLALDPQSGELKWKQQLAHVESANVIADPLRRLGGASPSFADGVLVCPTSAGAVVAVDVATRRLLWGVAYARGGEGRRSSRFDSPFAIRNIPRYGDRWVDGTATIVNGRVIVTPPDSGELHCLDLRTGKELWPSQQRDDLLFVAGVHEGTIVLVGKSRVVGIRLEDGKKAWAEIAIDTPSGRGLMDKSYYYQPTSSGKLHVIDIPQGEIAQSFETAKPLGNLVSYQDDILSLSHECLAAFPRVDRLERKIDEALAKNPEDPWALARRGELLMHEEKWEEALATLRKASSHANRDPAAPGLLVETILTLLEKDYAKHEPLSGEAEKLIDDPQSANRFHRLVAMGREKAGDRAGSFRAFLAIDSEGGAAAEGTLGNRDKLIDLDRGWRTRSDRWIAAHLSSLYAESSKEQQAEMDKAILERLNAIPRNSPARLRNFVERFAFHPAARQARLDLAAQLIDSNNLLEAERLLLPLIQVMDRKLAAQATALSAKSLMLAGRWNDATHRYSELANVYADIEAAPGKTGKQLRDDIAQQFEFRQALSAANIVYPRGRAVVEPDARSTVRNLPEQRRFYPLTLLQADGMSQSPPHVIHDPAQNTIRVRDSQGHDITVLSLNRPDNKRFYSNVAGLYTARLSGHLLVISTGHEVLAIDLLRAGRDPSEVIAWRQDFSDVSEQGVYTMVQTRGLANPWTLPRFIPADSNNRPMGVVSSITPHGVCFVKQRQLVCVDPLTGETIWTRNDVAQGCDLFGDNEYLFVSPHNSSEAQVYRMLDGALLGKRKVADFEHRWTTNGRRVLSWSQGTEGLKLQLDDIWTEKTIWSETAPSGSRAWLCSPDEVAMVTPAGQFKIRSLRSDAVRIETQLEKEPALQQLFVLKSREQYIVGVSVPPSNPIPNRNIQAAPGGNHSPLFTGKLYAFDVKTGEAMWPASAAISQMGLPLDQPLDQPVLLLLRNVLPRSGGGNQKAYTSLLCLDKRTGAVLHEEEEVPNVSQAYEIETESEGPIVRVALPGKSVRIRFTEEPAPPEPPVQYDQAFVAPSGSRGVGRALMRLFQPVESSADDLFGEP